MKLDDLAAEALGSVEALLAQAVASVRPRVCEAGRLSAAHVESEQRAVHGLAWLATYVEAIREMAAYARRLRAEGRFGETEDLLTRIGLGEYCAQIFGGVPMSQGEMLRLADFGLDEFRVAVHRRVRNGASGASQKRRAVTPNFIEQRFGLHVAAICEQDRFVDDEHGEQAAAA